MSLLHTLAKLIDAIATGTMAGLGLGIILAGFLFTISAMFSGMDAKILRSLVAMIFIMVLVFVITNMLYGM